MSLLMNNDVRSHVGNNLKVINDFLGFDVTSSSRVKFREAMEERRLMTDREMTSCDQLDKLLSWLLDTYFSGMGERTDNEMLQVIIAAICTC